MAIDLSKAFNRLDHGKLLTVLHDIGVPVCALRLLRSYLTNRSMRVHLSDAVSSLHELWGGEPQGGLLTILLFNINSNWIPDLCQPGISQEGRFLSNGPVTHPRCYLAQMRDCPPDYVSCPPHLCQHKPSCLSIPHHAFAQVPLSHTAHEFIPGAESHCTSASDWEVGHK